MSCTKITTSSDVELQVLLLTDEGKRKFERNEELKKDDFLLNPDKANDITIYFKIDKSFDEPFIVKFSTTKNQETDIWERTEVNCTVGDYTLEDGSIVSILKCYIPSGTFTTSGRLMLSIETNDRHFGFEDKKQLTVGLYEKTEVHYVVQ